jgi:putative IMPACT (imprinted ancient) family translation regulator
MLEYLDEKIANCGDVQAELMELRALKQKIDDMDGIMFFCNKGSNSSCKVTALWSASDIDVVRSQIKCPKCSMGQENHHCEKLLGQRRVVNSSAKILEKM